MLKDLTGKIINIGDKVIYLYKEYGYCKIANAYLIKGKYLGKGQYGHEFTYPMMNKKPWCKEPIRIKEPQVYKI